MATQGLDLQGFNRWYQRLLRWGSVLAAALAAAMCIVDGHRMLSLAAGIVIIAAFVWPLVHKLNRLEWTLLMMVVSLALWVGTSVEVGRFMAVSGLVLIPCCLGAAIWWQALLPMAAAVSRLWMMGRTPLESLELSAGLVVTAAALTGLAQILHHLSRERMRSAAQAESLAQLVQQLTDYDVLTGLHNRVFMEGFLAQAVAEASPFALIYWDIDRFADINSSFGPAVGDEVLRQLAARLVRLLNPDDMAFRTNADKFAVFVGGAKNKLSLAHLIGGWQAALEEPFQVKVVVDVTVSAGVVLFPEHGHRAEELMSHAEAALLRAKKAGRNSYRFYYDLPDNRSVDGPELRLSLREAVGRGQLAVHYQPQVDLDTGELCGVEALARWNHPEWGLVSPTVFVPVAEEVGLITEIGDWVLETACQEIRESELPPSIKLSVNFSAAQLARPDVVDRVQESLQRTHYDPRRLVLEVTESITINSIPRVIDKLNALRELGITISVDDFGTRYASLSYLRTFPVDELKIDKSFVADIVQYPAIPSAILTLAHHMNIHVVAEGIENEAQAGYLRLLGCQIAQGFLYAKPMPLSQLMVWIAMVQEQAHDGGTIRNVEA